MTFGCFAVARLETIGAPQNATAPGMSLDASSASAPSFPAHFERSKERCCHCSASSIVSLASDTIDDAEQWKQRSFDLSKWAGKDVELALEASSDIPGAVAFWGAPIVSSRATAKHPNVIFYVIDGGGADLMSVYGYNRRTTPFLERLAKEGVVFENAHSNSTWTQPSTCLLYTSPSPR